MKLNEKQLKNLIVKETRNILKESLPKRRSLKSLLPQLFEGEDKKSDDKEKSGVDLDVKKGPSAAVSYLNGPGADKRVRALLDAGKDDGDPKDEAAKISEGSAAIGDLVPTQIEIELTKSIAYPLAKFDSMKKMISGGVQRIGPKGNDMIVKSGDLIVDGHHRWSSLFSVAGPSGVIAAVDVTLPEKDAASVLAIVQTAIATTLDGEVPKAKAGGKNILGKGKDELKKLIESSVGQGGEAGEILADDFVQKCIDDDQVSKHFGLEGTKDVKAAREKIIDKVADNLSQMKQPAEGSPPRVDMPQLDKAGGGVQGVMDKLASGDVNYKAPFKKESASNEGEVIVERWQKLAGIIK